MLTYNPITVLPPIFQRLWRAQVKQATATERGVFNLIGIRQNEAGGYRDGRISVLVVDENGFALPDVKVAFAYSSADSYILSPDFLWSPPSPQKAFLAFTGGGGEIDQIQGSVVKEGERGGVTVHILEPEYSSDYVVGAGMLADHTGLHLIFQLKRVGVKSMRERLYEFEARLHDLEKAFISG